MNFGILRLRSELTVNQSAAFRSQPEAGVVRRARSSNDGHVHWRIDFASICAVKSENLLKVRPDPFAKFASGSCASVSDPRRKHADQYFIHLRTLPFAQKSFLSLALFSPPCGKLRSRLHNQEQFSFHLRRWKCKTKLHSLATRLSYMTKLEVAATTTTDCWCGKFLSLIFHLKTI
jgi:hypothetical protein